MQNLFHYIEQVAIRPSIHPNEEPVRAYIIEVLKAYNKQYMIDEVGNIHIIPKRDFKYLLCAHMDKQEAPNFQDFDTHIGGKLDDAVGVGIILALAEDSEFHALLTVAEETTSLGALFTVDRGLLPEVEGIIIIDTSPSKIMGKGPVFYSSFDNINPEKEFIDRIYSAANALKITVQSMPGAINDGTILIHANRNTIALEPHIDNYHTGQEISSKQDIVDTYNLIKGILTAN